MLPAPVLHYLSAHFRLPADQIGLKPAPGGCISQNYQLQLPSGHSFFCKVNSATKLPQLFEKEVQGLQLLRKEGQVAVPEILACSNLQGYQVLLLGWVQAGERNLSFWEEFGKQLAYLHGASSLYFGLEEDNYIGSLHQQNGREESWTLFFQQHRLLPLAQKCRDAGLLSAQNTRQLEHLYSLLPGIFDPEEKPALLHGDLWSGNFICDQNARPVLIDPAVYYGHRSVDLAMSRLFGGFAPRFYEAYHYYRPLPANYEQQWAVCELYPLLVHLLLFGSSYRPRIERTLKAFN